VIDIRGTGGGFYHLTHDKADSRVEFRTLRIREGNGSAIVVIFSEVEEVSWLIRFNVGDNAHKALEQL